MFHFKQFSVEDSACAMKVGTDGVLLGAWSEVGEAASILDVGTGCGLIALMMAQKNSRAHIAALEIDEAAAKQARQNVLASPWHHRIVVEQGDFTIWTPTTRYDAIVTNPPFFQETLLAPDQQRALARHTRTGLGFELLMKRSALLLRERGSLQLIAPKQAEEELLSLARQQGLNLVRGTDVRTVEQKNPKRVMLHFVKGMEGLPQRSTLVLMRDGRRSVELTHLCRHFYL